MKQEEQILAQRQAIDDLESAAISKVDALRSHLSLLEQQLSNVQQQHAVDKSSQESSITTLQQQVGATRLDLEECLKMQEKQELEHQRLYPFRRFVRQRPELVKQLAALMMPVGGADPVVHPAGPSVSCRVFYQRLKQLLGAYLMNSKLLSDSILVNGSTDTRQLLIDGFRAALDCATAFIPGSALVKSVADVAGKELMADHKQELKNELIQSTHLESFSMMEAEQLAQVVALVITKSYAAQVDELTVKACETLASDAVDRIAVSLLDAVAVMKRRYDQLTGQQTAGAPSVESKPESVTVSATSVTSPSSLTAKGDAGVSATSSLDHQAAVAVDRLCNLYLFAVRSKVARIRPKDALRKVLPRFVMKPSHAARDRKRHERWGPNGIFSHSAMAIPAWPSVTSPDALQGDSKEHNYSTLTNAAASAVGGSSSSASLATVPSVSSSPAAFDVLQLLTLPLNFWELVSVRSVLNCVW